LTQIPVGKVFSIPPQISAHFEIRNMCDVIIGGFSMAEFQKCEKGQKQQKWPKHM
jgi:hypothetical protein